MSNFDYLDLDGRLLRLLVTVHEEGSITRAAQRLGVTQSAVSHMLDKLRKIVGDPLFVKSGRSVVATAQAGQLAARAQLLLEQLHEFGDRATFLPAEVNRTLTIAANDLQRDLLLPRLFTLLRSSAPGIRLRVIPSNVPSAEMLRHEQCLLAISPRLPEGADIMHRRLFDSRYVVFFDGASRQAPENLQEYLAAEHITIVYEPRRTLDIDDHLAHHGIHRRFVVKVPNFSGIRPFLQGSSLLATLPSHLGTMQLSGFCQADTPFACPSMPMYAIWHQRAQHDPMMRWLLDSLYAISHQVAHSSLPWPPQAKITNGS